MSAVGFHFNRSVSTTLDLNGPILSFIEQPQSVSTDGDTITMSGIATVSFGSTDAVNDGTIEYQWYEIGVGPLQDSDNATGSATTTLTLQNLTSPQDNGRQFYLESTYIPTASTGNSINAPHESDVATLTTFPIIEIIAQPSNATTIPNRDVTFNIDASLSDTTFAEGLTYQWLINGENAVEGTQEVKIPVSRFDQTFSSDTTLEIPADALNIEIEISGGSGGRGGSDTPGPGGEGGAGRYGKFEYITGARTLDLRPGRNGNDGGRSPGAAGVSITANGGRGGSDGEQGWSGSGGGGGGASGVFDRSLGYYTIVAGGGGGGGGGSWQVSGTDATDAGSFEEVSSSFQLTQGSNGGDKRGDGGGGGGGGGGATGGFGGDVGTDRVDGGKGGGGGGSKYSTEVVTSLVDEQDSDGSGFIKVKYDVPEGSDSTGIFKILSSTTLSGTQTETLTASTINVGIQTVACVLSHPTASNSPVTSDTALFSTISNELSYPLRVEEIGGTSEANIVDVELFNGEFTLKTTASGDISNNEFTSFYSIYAPDKDLNLEIDLYGGKGTSVGGNVGGEGGFSRIRFTMEQNVEYVVTGLNPLIDAPFLYRKGSLIACVGQGGSAGTSSNGGFGGGIGVSGDKGSGRRGGEGGQSVFSGTLSNIGVFGSFFTTANPVAPDTIAPSPDGGRTLPCPYGVFWRNQGVSACSDVGNTQFRLSDGTIVYNTRSIQRGFKAGYSIIETAGLGEVNGGNGGNGATGGRGGIGGDGGGGASGYTDGSVTVVSSILGGSNDVARVVIRIVD